MRCSIIQASSTRDIYGVGQKLARRAASAVPLPPPRINYSLSLSASLRGCRIDRLPLLIGNHHVVRSGRVTSGVQLAGRVCHGVVVNRRDRDELAELAKLPEEFSLEQPSA